MTTADLDSYVRAALAMQGYAFDETRIAAITEQFTRIEAMSRTFRELDLPLELEAAPVFLP